MFGNWEGVERQIHATCNFLVIYRFKTNNEYVLPPGE